MPRATLDKRPADVARMFDVVAERYDAMNAVMTFGQERRWRRVVATAVGAAPGLRVLDLAAGAGATVAPVPRARAVTGPGGLSPGHLPRRPRPPPPPALVARDGPPPP